MCPSKNFCLIIFLFLFGCADTVQQTETLDTLTPPSPVRLPHTWTPTAYLAPSETPIRPATLTFTPLPSVTQLPLTLTASPTSDAPTLEVPAIVETPTQTPTLVSDCDFWTLEEGAPINSVPFDETFSLLPTMIPSVTYQAVTHHPTYYELMLDGEPVGWADYRLLSVRSEGPGCSNLPFDEREMTEFRGLCFFTPDNREVEVFSDSALTKYSDTIAGTHPHRILLRYKDVYYSNNGRGTPHIYVDASRVRTFGDCVRIPRAGITTTESGLWSQPTWHLGEQVGALPADTDIAIHEGPVQGPKPPGVSESGYWYLVKVPWYQDGTPYGWIWSSFFKFE